MKNTISTIILFTATAALFAQSGQTATAQNRDAEEKPFNYKTDDFRNYFGSWAEITPQDSLLFCKNMGYKYVIYKEGMENCKASKGMYFLLVDPEFLTYNRNLNMSKSYTKEQIEKWRDICAMKDAAASFPECMATGWFWNIHRADIANDVDWTDAKNLNCSLQLNFQKRKVVDMAVNGIIDKAKRIMKKNPDFKYGGCIWDVPQLTGDFYAVKKEWKKPRQVGMSFWRGVDCVSVPDGVKLDYPTYSEGYLAFFRKLRCESRKLNPDVKFIVDPWNLHRDYIAHFQKLNVSPTDDGFADLVQTESNDAKFVTDPKVLDSGYVDIPRIGQAGDLCSYDFAREIALVGLAASKGAWTSWFGNPCPGLPSIRDVPARMKITRALGTWENLNNTPISKRKFDVQKKIYSSPTAYMSYKLVWAIKPKTDKLFFCMNESDAVLNIPDGWELEKIVALTSIFSEYPKPKLEKNFDIADGKIALKSNSKYLAGQGFVAYLKNKSAGSVPSTDN